MQLIYCYSEKINTEKVVNIDYSMLFFSQNIFSNQQIQRCAGFGTGAVEGSLGKERNESVKSKDRVHVSEWNATRKC